MPAVSPTHQIRPVGLDPLCDRVSHGTAMHDSQIQCCEAMSPVVGGAPCGSGNLTPDLQTHRDLYFSHNMHPNCLLGKAQVMRK